MKGTTGVLINIVALLCLDIEDGLTSIVVFSQFGTFLLTAKHGEGVVRLATLYHQ